MVKRLFPLFLLLIVLTLSGCSRHYCDYAVMGADEFVMDSYVIRQGKFAILEMMGVEVEELDPDAMCEYKDVIAEDDILNIAVYHPKRKDLMESVQFINHTVGGFRVYKGKVDLPDIPPVEVSGLTLDEARERLREEFLKQIQDIEVFVTYHDRLTRKVELAGMAAHANVPVDGKMRLYDVIANAHIPPDANLFMSYVVRDGRPLAVDLYKLINEGDMCQNIVMHGGDKIFIANKADSNVMVMGEVHTPRPVHLPYGFMSLREALVNAGGIPFTGDKKHIQVIRGNLQCPKIYVLAWEHIVNLPNDSLLLMPGDTVYVTAKAITEWNRFISQLLPSAQVFQAGYGAFQLVYE
jgi:polysaccharide export outer membrane protein